MGRRLSRDCPAPAGSEAEPSHQVAAQRSAGARQLQRQSGDASSARFSTSIASTCHNDRTKTANFSLEKSGSRHRRAITPELWEKVVRKLRAGVMPPPDLQRPSLADYEGLRDWLETEIDRKAATRVNPGSVVLHRLNRTEYANAVRDLLDLEIDVRSASAAGRFGQRLRQHRGLADDFSDTARGLYDRSGEGRPHGGWLLEDRRPNPPILRRATRRRISTSRGCRLAPAAACWCATTSRPTASTRFSIQNFGIGSFIPGEQLELIIDGERAHLFKYEGVGTSSGMQADGDGVLEVSVPVKAGSRMVGATFLATNFRPSLDVVKQYDRKSLENNAIPQLQYYPAIGFLTDSRAVRCAAPGRLAQHPQGLHLPAGQRQPGGGLREGHPDDAGAARLSASSDCAGPAGPDGVLRGRPPRRARSTRGSSWDFGGSWRALSSSSAPRKNQPIWQPGRPIASATWNWLPGCRFSCGAAFPTTS